MTGNCRPSHPSGPAVADGNLPLFDDNRYLPLAFRELEHFIQFRTVRLYIEIDRLSAIGRPGLFRVRSACLPEYHYLVRHGVPPRVFIEYLIIISFYGCKSKLFEIESESCNQTEQILRY